MTVIGAGVIGCEYASIFGGLGAKVELINPNQSLLTFLDTEISDALAYHLRNVGVRSRHGEQTEKIEYHDDYLVTYLCSGKKLRAILCCGPMDVRATLRGWVWRRSGWSVMGAVSCL